MDRAQGDVQSLNETAGPLQRAPSLKRKDLTDASEDKENAAQQQQQQQQQGRSPGQWDDDSGPQSGKRQRRDAACSPPGTAPAAPADEAALAAEPSGSLATEQAPPAQPHSPPHPAEGSADDLPAGGQSSPPAPFAADRGPAALLTDSPTIAKPARGFGEDAPDWVDRPLYLKEGLQEDEEVDRFNYLAGPPLSAVACEGKEALVAAILRQGAGAVDERDNFGNTALHLAAKHGRTSIVAALLAAGAAQLRNKQGQLPLDLAVKAGHTEIIGMLQQALSEGDERKPQPRQLAGGGSPGGETAALQPSKEQE